MVRLTLNGQSVEFNGNPDTSLLSWLRNDQHVTSAKDGCSGQAACGACLVEVNGKAVLSCSTPMRKVDGGNVVTLEGFPENLRRTLGRAFVSKGAVQCGFCTPGFLTRTKILLASNPCPTREEVVKAVRPHLCRCTGYVKIVDAILEAAKALQEKSHVEFEKAAGIGVSTPKYHALERALGTKPFVDDLRLEGMLHGALCFSEHPRARVVALDTTKAEKAPGVIRVFSARDIPANHNVGLVVLDWPLMIAEGDTTRYIGDVLAGVVAKTEEQARAAVQLIDVTYEELDALTDMREAEQSPIRVHKEGNLLLRKEVKRGGDLKEILANSAYTAQGIFETQPVDHAFLEVECCVAEPTKNGVRTYSQSQGVYGERHEIAGMLGLPEKDVEVVLVDCGGAFGGKEDMTTQGHAALYSYLLQQPVKVKLSRGESIRMHPKRHPTLMEYEVGCDESGMLTGLYARILGDTGAYASVGGAVMARAATHASGAYHFPAVDIEAKAVYTNNIPCGAMRGFGVNQVTFAVEGLIDELCIKGGFDQWQFRHDNALAQGRMVATGQVLGKGVGLRQCLDAIKAEYTTAKHSGLACAIKNCGMGNGLVEKSKTILEINPDGSITLDHGWTEMGQGIHTVAMQILRETAGLDESVVIHPRVTTASEAIGGPTTASRGTLLLGRAMIQAGEKLRNDLENASLKELAGKRYEGEFICDYTQDEGEPGKIISHISYGFAVNLALLDDTGRLKRLVAAHDAGRIMNPKLFEGQIEGGVAMGIGYALYENVPLENGRLTSDRLARLGVPKIHKLPEIAVIGVESNDPEGPYGAKGVGEIGCIAAAPAIANAFSQYDNRRRYSLPLEQPMAKT